MPCNAEAQRSEVCIVDGAFAWQTKSSDSVAAETSAVDLSSDENALVAREDVIANDVLPTLADINFTVPKVSDIVLIYIVSLFATSAEQYVCILLCVFKNIFVVPASAQWLCTLLGRNCSLNTG